MGCPAKFVSHHGLYKEVIQDNGQIAVHFNSERRMRGK